eukprot:5158023-Pleurochrysis_carterae.AAC.4
MLMPDIFSIRSRLGDIVNRNVFYKAVVLSTLGGIVADPALICLRSMNRLFTSGMFISTKSRVQPTFQLFGAREPFAPLLRVLSHIGRSDTEVDVSRSIGHLLLKDAVVSAEHPGVLLVSNAHAAPAAAKDAPRRPAVLAGRKLHAQAAEECLRAARAAVFPTGGEVRSLADAQISAEARAAAAACFGRMAPAALAIALKPEVRSEYASAFSATRRWVERATHARQRVLMLLQRMQQEDEAPKTVIGGVRRKLGARGVARWQRLSMAVGGASCSAEEVHSEGSRRICILMVDNRPLTRSVAHAVSSGGWSDLTTYANFAYAARLNYTFLRAQYSMGLLHGRAYLWSKVLVLWRVAQARRDCHFLVFIDTDAHFQSLLPLETVLRMANLMPKEGEPEVNKTRPLFLFPREPAGRNKFKDFEGNSISNTRMSTGFIAVANTPRTREMLHEWWLVPVRHRNMSRYTYQWAHEQLVWDAYMRDKYPGLWVELPERETAPALLNTPQGTFVRHQWWKKETAWQDELRGRVKLMLEAGALEHRTCAHTYSISATDITPRAARARKSNLPQLGSDASIRGCNAFKLLSGFSLTEPHKCTAPALFDLGCVVANVPSIGTCCVYCQQSAGCNAFTYMPGTKSCIFSHTAEYEVNVRQKHDPERWVGLALSKQDALNDLAMRRQAERASDEEGLQDAVVVVTSFASSSQKS